MVAVVFLWFLGLFPMALGKAGDKADVASCMNRLIVLKLSISDYKTDNGKYPDALTNLVPESVAANLILCPKPLREGKSMEFEYHRPESAEDTNQWLLKTPAEAGYLENKKPVVISITLGGKINLEAITNSLTQAR